MYNDIEESCCPNNNNHNSKSIDENKFIPVKEYILNQQLMRDVKPLEFMEEDRINNVRRKRESDPDDWKIVPKTPVNADENKAKIIQNDVDFKENINQPVKISNDIPKIKVVEAVNGNSQMETKKIVQDNQELQKGLLNNVQGQTRAETPSKFPSLPSLPGLGSMVDFSESAKMVLGTFQLLVIPAPSFKPQLPGSFETITQGLQNLMG